MEYIIFNVDVKFRFSKKFMAKGKGQLEIFKETEALVAQTASQGIRPGLERISRLLEILIIRGAPEVVNYFLDKGADARLSNIYNLAKKNTRLNGTQALKRIENLNKRVKRKK